MRRPDKMKAILRGEDNLLGNITPERYAQAVRNMPTARSSSADRAIIEAAYKNPEAFDLDFGGIKRGPFRGLTNPKAGYRTLNEKPLPKVESPLLLPAHISATRPTGASRPEFDSYGITGGVAQRNRPEINVLPSGETPILLGRGKMPLDAHTEWFDNTMRAPRSPYMEDMPLSVARTYANGEAAIGYVRTKRKPPVRKSTKVETPKAETPKEKAASRDAINPLKAKVVDPMRPVGKRGQKKRGNKGKGKKKLEFGGDIPMFQTPAGSLPGYEYDIRDRIANTIPFIGDLTKLGIVNGTNIASYRKLKPGIDAQKNVKFFAPRKSIITPNLSSYGRAKRDLMEAYNSYDPSVVSDLGINAAINNGKFQSLLSNLTNIDKQESDYLNKSDIENANRYDYNYSSEGQTAAEKSQHLARVALSQAQAESNLTKQIGSVYNDFITNQNQRFANKLKNYNVGRDNLRKVALAKLKQNDPTNATQYDNDYLWQTLWAKQGGKTRTMEEQMAIDAARSNQKVIQKMNDSLAKMLIRLMK